MLPGPAPKSPLIICCQLRGPTSSVPLTAFNRLVMAALRRPRLFSLALPRLPWALHSPAPQRCIAVPRTTGLSPTCPRANNLSLCISLPVTGAICPWRMPRSVGPFSPYHSSARSGHLWRDPICLLQPWDSWVSKAPNTHMHRHTHMSLLPVDAKPLAQATLLEWEQPLMLLPGLSCSVAAHIPGRGCLQEGSSCRLRRHLPGLLVGSGTPLGERLRNAVQGAGLGELQQGAGRTYPAQLPAAVPGVPEVGQGCWQLWSCPCPMPPCSAAVTEKHGPVTHQP